MAPTPEASELGALKLRASRARAQADWTIDGGAAGQAAEGTRDTRRGDVRRDSAGGG